MSLDHIQTSIGELTAAPDYAKRGWQDGVADHILEEAIERTGKDPVFRPREVEMSVNEVIARNYIRTNYEREDIVALVYIRRSDGATRQEMMTAEQAESRPIQVHLRDMNERGIDIFISQASFLDTTSRKKENVAEVRHIFLDLDKDGTKYIEEIARAHDMPKPHHILESSPGKYQAIWSVDGFSVKEAEDLMRTLIPVYMADEAAKDVTRVLRLPGFQNHKYPELNHFVYDVNRTPAVKEEYNREEFPTAVAREELYLVRGSGRQQNVSREGWSTQSEADMAWAHKQLRAGVDRHVIIADLAASRPDKPNPGYYANHTVEKAEEYRRSRGLQQQMARGV